MENLTLGEFVRDQKDTQSGAILQSQIAKAKSVTDGFRFDDVKIRGVDEMGDAAGTCNMCTQEIKVREDVVATEAGVREDLSHVLVHEAMHAEGIAHDGIAELAVELKLGKPPVPAYRAKHEHAQELASVIGKREVIEIAKEENADVLLVQEYVKARIAKGLSANDNGALEEVTEEAAEHVRLAA